MPAHKPFSVTLMIPGLMAFPPQRWQELTSQIPALPALTTLLNQARCVSRTASNFETMLATKFGFSPQHSSQQHTQEHTQEQLPVAALTYWYDKGRPPSRAVLRADPVYLKVDRDCLYLFGRNSLHVSMDEAKAVITQINSVYSDTLWSMEIGAADRWYVSFEDEIGIQTHSLTDAFGKNIHAYLPQGAVGKKWRAVLNEIQMLLHNSNVNLRRDVNRHLPINSIWLWGEGPLPSRPANRVHTFDYVWSNEPLCRGLALWAQCPGDELPSTASEWIKRTPAGRHLIVFDDMRILAREDFQSFKSKLIELDKTWLASLQKAVTNGQIQLNIEIENGTLFECSKPHWFNWLRKKRLWHEWLQ
jgi:hypothetical protein